MFSPQNLCEGIDVCISLVVEIISEYAHVSMHHIVYLQDGHLLLSIIPHYNWGRKKKLNKTTKER
jgi:hypothetical protein